MYSIIDGSRLIAFLRFAGAAAGVLAIWALIAGVAALTEPTSTVTVFGPRATLARAVDASDVELLDAGNGFIIVQGRRPGFVLTLYAAGAWGILPGDIGACRATNFSQRG